ncbi:MAG: hypothetical protein ACSHX7_14150 [Luteolibacter sp.]
MIGFLTGGSLLLLQALFTLFYGVFTNQVEPDVPALITWVVAILVGGVFILAVAYWISSVFIVFPVSFLFRALRISAPTGSVIGVFIAGAVIVSLVRIPGFGNSMDWPSYLFCFSSPLIIGAITGYTLAKILKEGEQVGDGDAEETV